MVPHAKGKMTTTPPKIVFQPGQRVAVIQQIAQRDEVWTGRVEGAVVGFERKKTGSWYAHSKDDRLWLDRLTLRKDDGEIVVINLDPYTHVDVLAPAAAPGSGDPPRDAGPAAEAAA